MTNTDWVMVSIIVCGCVGLWIMYLIDKKHTREWNDFVHNVIEEDDALAQRIAEGLNDAYMVNDTYMVTQQPEQDEYIRWLYPEAQRFAVRYNPIEGDFSDNS